jgi:hypothetical protein
VHERLRQVAAELALDDVVFLGQQPRRPARGAVALEVADRRQLVALLMLGQGHHEPAQQERAFGIAERALVVTEPLDMLLLDQLIADRAQGGESPRVGGGQGAADRGQQEGASGRGSSRPRCQ